MSADNRASRLFTQALSPEAFEKVQAEQTGMLDEFLAHKPGFWELPDRQSTQTEMLPRANAMHRRLEQILALMPGGVEDVVSSDEKYRLHMIPKTLGNFVAGIEINIFDQAPRWSAKTIIFTEDLSMGDTQELHPEMSASVVEAIHFYDAKNPFSGKDTQNAILGAEQLFNILTNPVEKALGLIRSSEPTSGYNDSSIPSKATF